MAQVMDAYIRQTSRCTRSVPSKEDAGERQLGIRVGKSPRAVGIPWNTLQQGDCAIAQGHVPCTTQFGRVYAPRLTLKVKVLPPSV